MDANMRMVSSIAVVCCLLWCSCSKKQTSNPDTRLAWHTQTLVKAYDSVGHRNPKWDEAAHKVLTRFAEVRAGKEDLRTDGSVIGAAAQDAMSAGCDDPMILYL